MKEIKSVLIIGASGGLANILCGIITRKYPNIKIIGVDTRNPRVKITAPNFEFVRIKYTRGNFEKIFRERNIDALFHLGRMSHSKSTSQSEIEERLNLNLIGTNKILELALKYQLQKVIVLSTHHVYGALSDNPVFIKEDAPLRASIKYPELRDVTEMDSICTNWMWKYKDQLQTIVLRPCNIIGPQINNTISQYLRSSIAPIPIDFNPTFQFIHELDMASIISECLFNVETGIYNVAPEETITLKEAKELVAHSYVPFPVSILSPVAKIVKKLWTFPDYLIDYIKHPCIIDGRELMKRLPDSEFRFTTKQALKLLRL
ncbi:NAD-dependent epimerase/dehydratase family protein [Bacteriovorax sp. Seq25_V]|uniref:NAD-dependent epimerase/dehydratase family protein n=1 Tax=Bacteriovorax sp. Seq25_V TaxID=1201288 RepID=UPI00038A2C62|nr:NAD-dependent epimerase/dehydratase family protein [Bacteriovorax sp. Seq25_V]EQC47291.1 NAD dependent epimerase/dehydratase family protein [Bacteriovorax sp. Seq25_V]